MHCINLNHDTACFVLIFFRLLVIYTCDNFINGAGDRGRRSGRTVINSPTKRTYDDRRIISTALGTKNRFRGSFSDGKMCYMSLEPE